MVLQAGFSLVTLKLVFLLALFFFTGPVVTHALAQACLHEDIQPMLAEDRRGRDRTGGAGRTAGGSHRSRHQRMALLTLLAVVTLAIIRQRSLFGVVILSSIYSFLMASVLIVLDAVDVAMTEASVGAGVSTVLLLATLHLIKTTEMRSVRRRTCCRCSSRSAPAPFWSGARSCCRRSARPTRSIHKHVAPRYIADTIKETNVPNVVTSVLADYRGYDTLGETTVIFTAGIGVMLLLRGMRRRGRPSEDEARR